MLARFKRLAILNGTAIILFGMIVPGFAATWLVTRDVYHQPIPIDPGTDYRGWLMAHLEGLLNGLLVIGLALGSAIRSMTARRSQVLLWALVTMGWGNTIAATLSPVFGVRAMALNRDPANDVLVLIYFVALIATLASFYILIRHLWSDADDA